MDVCVRGWRRNTRLLQPLGERAGADSEPCVLLKQRSTTTGRAPPNKGKAAAQTTSIHYSSFLESDLLLFSLSPSTATPRDTTSDCDHRRRALWNGCWTVGKLIDFWKNGSEIWIRPYPLCGTLPFPSPPPL